MGTVENAPFEPIIKVRGQVGECICRAILRPSKNPDRFLSGPDEDPDYQELGFSKNRVSLEISGLELTDPSFRDLPGTLLPLFPVRLEPNVFGKGLIASVGQGGNTSDIDLCTSQAPIFRGREFPLSRCGTCRPRACAEDVQRSRTSSSKSLRTQISSRSFTNLLAPSCAVLSKSLVSKPLSISPILPSSSGYPEIYASDLLVPPTRGSSWHQEQ